RKPLKKGAKPLKPLIFKKKGNCCMRIFENLSKFAKSSAFVCMLTHGQGLTPLTILKKQIKPF
ncbi:hypothetical protein, partial [Aerococcus urinaeequi]|uniref:hypothetical protein n=1 Tax=Aerococcus urinaeequi TaxID=51665 RepID=UPI003AAF45FD